MLLPPKVNPDIGVQSSDPHFVTAGNKGVLRVWNSKTAVCVYSQQNSLTEVKGEISEEGQQQAIVDLTFTEKTGTFNVVTYDHNVILYEQQDFSLKKQVN